jgi:hypothetical protein
MADNALLAKSDPAVRATYAVILKATEKFGPVRIEEKKTSIHLAAKTAFAGVHPQKASLVLTVRSAAAIDSPRVKKAERVSANRWHNDMKLSGPSEVDRELIGWLKAAYALSNT